MTLSIGLIGTGGFSKVHADILTKMDGVSVKAFVGTSMDKAEKAAQGYASAKGYGDIEHMLDEAKPDAVYVCVPPFAHGEIERKLVERGIPFLVEKPLGINLEAPQEILKGVTTSGLITSVGYHLRYTDAALKAVEVLRDRKTGMALGYWMGNMPLVSWWRKQDGSGGQFIEQTTHMVDMLRFLLGEVDEVYAAFAQRAMHEVHDGVTVPDVGTVTLKLKSGAVATISNTCMLPTSEKVGLAIYTDQGSVDVLMDKLVVKENSESVEYPNIANAYQRENEAFIHAVRTGDTSRILSSYEDAYKTMEITYAAQQSAETGMPVKL